MALPFPYVSVHTLILLLALSVSSCKKEKASINTILLPTGTSQDLKAIALSGEDTIYIAGGENDKGIILRSIDGGASFTILNEFKYCINALEVSGDELYAVGDSFNLFYSANAGTDWSETWLINSPSIEYQTHLRDVEVRGSNIYFCGGWSLARGVIGRSQDKGVNWEYTVTEHEMRSIQMMDELHGVCVGNGAILTTSDGAKTWQMQDAQNEFWTATAAGTSIVASSFGGKIIQSENNGASWKTLSKSNSFISNGLLAVAANSMNELIAVGVNGKGLYSANGGSDWKKVQGFDDSHIYAVLFNKGSTGLASAENGKLYSFSFR